MLTISGTVHDDTGAPAAGSYSISTSYAGECNVLFLDDSAGTTYNDIVARATPS